MSKEGVRQRKLYFETNSNLNLVHLKGIFEKTCELKDPFGRQGGLLLQGSFYEVSLALVGVASLAYFQY